jgi:hypothetical protein
MPKILKKRYTNKLNKSQKYVELYHIKKIEVYSKRDPIKAKAEGTLLI